MKNQLIKIMLGISAIPAFAHSMEKPLSVDLFVGATGLNKIELLRSYIDKGVNLDAIDSFGNTALTTAAEYNNIVAARMLLANGADVNAKNGFCDTALHVAETRSNEEMVRLLLDAHASLSIASEGETPLISAVRWCSALAIIEMLLEYGADASITDNDGWSALKWADVLFKPKLISLLQSYRKKKLE